MNRQKTQIKPPSFYHNKFSEFKSVKSDRDSEVFDSDNSEIHVYHNDDESSPRCDLMVRYIRDQFLIWLVEKCASSTGGDDIFEGETLMIDEKDLWQMFKLGWVIVVTTGNKLRSKWRNVPARQGG